MFNIAIPASKFYKWKIKLEKLLKFLTSLKQPHFVIKKKRKPFFFTIPNADFLWVDGYKYFKIILEFFGTHFLIKYHHNSFSGTPCMYKLLFTVNNDKGKKYLTSNYVLYIKWGQTNDYKLTF